MQAAEDAAEVEAEAEAQPLLDRSTAYTLAFCAAAPWQGCTVASAISCETRQRERKRERRGRYQTIAKVPDEEMQAMHVVSKDDGEEE